MRYSLSSNCSVSTGPHSVTMSASWRENVIICLSTNFHSRGQRDTLWTRPYDVWARYPDTMLYISTILWNSCLVVICRSGISCRFPLSTMLRWTGGTQPPTRGVLHAFEAARSHLLNWSSDYRVVWSFSWMESEPSFSNSILKRV